MKRNGKMRNAGRVYRQGGIGMRKLTALLLALTMALAMLGAAAEGLDEALIPGESVQANDEAITVGNGTADEGLGLADDAILEGDGLSLDGLEDNLLTDGLPELEIVAEDAANALVGNESKPEDFEIDGNGVLVKYKGAGGDVVIPDGVTAIGDEAFLECYSLTSVTIPNGVTQIGNYAFETCRNLTSVTILDGVTNFGESAFSRCVKLASVRIPYGVTRIRFETFYGCGSLKSVTIPDSVTSIGFQAFYACGGLKSLTIPDSVTSIDDQAFRACDSLTSVTIPNSVTTVGEAVFCNCINLRSATIPSGLKKLSKDMFYGCFRLSDIHVTQNATNNGESASYSCNSQTGATIPDGVESIGDSAFAGCSSLPSVRIPDSVTHIGQKAFTDCTSLVSVTIGAGLSIEDLIYSCLLDCDLTELFEVTENNGVYASRDGVLYTYDMRTLLQCPEAKKSVTIPDSVTGIGDWAFAYCSRLKNVIIPDNVTSIGVEAFYGCTGMKDVYIPASVKSIGKGAFRQYDWEKDREINLGLTIHGYAGSYAETYARKNGLKFSATDDSLAKAKITVSAQVYTGKALKPAVKVVLNGKTLKKGKDYTVRYKNNKAVGTATVTVTGKGAYTGAAKATFRINPKAVAGLKLTAGKGLINVSWKKSAGGISGYQLQYGLKKDFSGAKKAIVSKSSTVKSTIKNLKTGKTYYVRIRAWKKVGKTTYWSTWSETKKARVG